MSLFYFAKKSSQMRASAVEREVSLLHSAQGYVVISYREGRRRYFIQMEVSLLHRIRGYVVILFREGRHHYLITK